MQQFYENFVIRNTETSSLKTSGECELAYFVIKLLSQLFQKRKINSDYAQLNLKVWHNCKDEFYTPKQWKNFKHGSRNAYFPKFIMCHLLLLFFHC